MDVDKANENFPGQYGYHRAFVCCCRIDCIGLLASLALVARLISIDHPISHPDVNDCENSCCQPLVSDVGFKLKASLICSTSLAWVRPMPNDSCSFHTYLTPR